MATTAYVIPHDKDKPITPLVLDGDYIDEIVLAVFGQESGPLGWSTLRGADIQFFYDDVGLYLQPENINHRAMKLWAHAAGRSLDDFRQPLVGNYVVLGVNRIGDMTDVPSSIESKLTEEWMSL